MLVDASEERLHRFIHVKIIAIDPREQFWLMDAKAAFDLGLYGTIISLCSRSF
jgi:hypothetical protein